MRARQLCNDWTISFNTSINHSEFETDGSRYECQISYSLSLSQKKKGFSESQQFNSDDLNPRGS